MREIKSYEGNRVSSLGLKLTGEHLNNRGETFICATCRQILQLEEGRKIPTHRIKVSRRQDYICSNSGKIAK